MQNHINFNPAIPTRGSGGATSSTGTAGLPPVPQNSVATRSSNATIMSIGLPPVPQNSVATRSSNATMSPLEVDRSAPPTAASPQSPAPTAIVPAEDAPLTAFAVPVPAVPNVGHQPQNAQPQEFGVLAEQSVVQSAGPPAQSAGSNGASNDPAPGTQQSAGSSNGASNPASNPGTQQSGGGSSSQHAHRQSHPRAFGTQRLFEYRNEEVQVHFDDNGSPYELPLDSTTLAWLNQRPYFVHRFVGRGGFAEVFKVELCVPQGTKLLLDEDGEPMVDPETGCLELEEEVMDWSHGTGLITSCERSNTFSHIFCT